MYSSLSININSILLVLALLLHFLPAQSQPVPIDNQYFMQVDAFFKKNVNQQKINYAAIANNPTELLEILKITDNASLDELDMDAQKAFYINAYNLSIIKSIVLHYPVNSVQDIAGFFDEKEHKIAGKYMTINALEKEILLKKYADPRLHFVLVCGAVGCPPIANFAYFPKKIDQQLQKQTALSINNPDFIQVNQQKASVSVSKIFEWYQADFGEKKIVDYINKFRKNKISKTNKINYLSYDWSLNDTNLGKAIPNNANRYIASSLLRKKQLELKIFNNLYTQKTGFENQANIRSTFFTTLFQFLYGIHPKFNVGFDVKVRSVRNGLAEDSPLGVFRLEQTQQARWGVTALGPKLRIAPLRALPNFSIQSTLYFPIGEQLDGSSDRPYIDWQGKTFLTQFFSDFSLGRQFSLFAEVDILLENISTKNSPTYFTTPFKSIFSYFPNPKTTIYLSGEIAPTWSPSNYYWQSGVGTKYQFSPYAEIELLYTRFSNRYLAEEANGRASTFNLGLRFTY